MRHTDAQHSLCTPTPAVTLVAPPKSGSSFLATFLRVLSSAASLCMLHATRYRCSFVMTIGCAPRWGGQARCHGPAPRCSWIPQAGLTSRLMPTCCDAIDAPNSSELLEEPSSAPAAPHRQIDVQPRDDSLRCERREPSALVAARRWLDERPRQWLWQRRAGDGHLPERLADAIRHGGFVAGPNRLHPISTEPTHTPMVVVAAQSAAPLPLGPMDGVHPGFANVLILHTRHPLEALISHYFCLALPHVCPKRHASTRGRRAGGGGGGGAAAGGGASGSSRAALGNQSGAAQHEGIYSFLRAELAGASHTSANQLLRRYGRLADLLERAKATAAASTTLAYGGRPLGSGLAADPGMRARVCWLKQSDSAQPPTATQKKQQSAAVSPPHDDVAHAPSPFSGPQSLKEPSCGRHPSRVHNGPRSACAESATTTTLTVLVSRYEHMVSDFGGWVAALVQHLPPSAVPKSHRDGQRQMEHLLRTPFEGDFVADGKHRHALHPGANLKQLSARARTTLLAAEPRIADVVHRLGYTVGSPFPAELNDQ